MKVPAWILEKPSKIRARWRAFLRGTWEPCEWVEARPLLFRPYGAVEGAHLYRFGEAMNLLWKGKPLGEAEAGELMPVLRRLWTEYPCLFLPRTRLTAWLAGHQQEPEVAKLIEEILLWPEGRTYRGTAQEMLEG